MASNIDPSISLGGRPPPTLTLPQMLDFARGAQAFQREREIMPELVEQARIGTGTARIGQEQAGFTLSTNQNNALMNIVGGFRNDPRIASGDPDAALSALDEIKAKAMALNIPRSMVERMAGTATSIAINDPKRLAQYFDNVIQSQAGAAVQQSLQTPTLTNLGNALEVFTPATRTLTQPRVGQPTRQDVSPTSQDVAQPSQNVAQPLPNARVEPPATGITGRDLTRPIAGADAAGYELRFPPLPSDVRNLRPPMPGEAEVAAAGTTYLNELQKAQGAVPTAMRSVSQVISGAQQVGEKINFETGALADIERNLRVFFTDDIYQQLNKDLANAQIARMRASGGDLSTDAGKSLAAAAGGTATLSPRVLIKIAGELAGELTKTDMESRGAQRAVRLFGPANLSSYQQAWNDNAKDTRVFEAIYIDENVANEKNKKEALTKIVPTSEQELELFRKRLQNIRNLSETGTLK